MKTNEAKHELKRIMKQKTVSISRLSRVLGVLDYADLEKRYIQQGQKIKRQKDRLRYLEGKR